MLVSCTRSRFSIMSASSLAGRFIKSNRRVKASRLGSSTLPFCIRLVTFSLDCRSMICPDKKASWVSSAASVSLRSAARKVDSRACSSGTAQGSARWSAPPLRASSRRISRAQSSAPVSTQPDWVRPRSAASTSTARHCCHSALAASVATNTTVSMAVRIAAPRWLCDFICPLRWSDAASRA